MRPTLDAAFVNRSWLSYQLIVSDLTSLTADNQLSVPWAVMSSHCRGNVVLYTDHSAEWPTMYHMSDPGQPEQEPSFVRGSLAEGNPKCNTPTL